MPATSQLVTPGVSGTAAVAAPASTTWPARNGMFRRRHMSSSACSARTGSPRIAAVEPVTTVVPADSRTARLDTLWTGRQGPTTYAAAEVLSATTSP